MQGRRVLEKHKHFALYHPSAFYIATVIADIPLAFIQVIIFEICVYFMMGLQLEAGRVSKSIHFYTRADTLTPISSFSPFLLCLS